MNDYKDLYDVIIVGGGPAGLAAAIYSARANEKVLVIEKNEFGGQIALTAKVANYPGLAECSGRELADQMKEQAREFGAELIYATVKNMELDYSIKVINTDKGKYRALSVILAPGAVPRNAGFEGEAQYKGKGVAYCATCDGPLFAGCDLFVVGGGLAAVEEAIFLSKFSSNITLVVRENDFTCAKTVSDKLKLYAGIHVLFHTEIIEISGQGFIDTVVLKDNMSGDIRTITTDDPPFGVFVFVGYQPNTTWISSIVNKDAEGYILTDDQCKTNIDGVYAAGDVRQKALRQVVTATADGAVSSTASESYIKEMHSRLDIPELVEKNHGIISEITEKAILKIWTDDSPLSKEMLAFADEEEGLKDKVIIEIHDEGRADIMLPSIEICKPDGNTSGIHFHAVPKGLEWNSFQMALFNVAGPGQKVEEDVLARIRQIDRKMNLTILATLTCGNCPTSVMSAMLIAALNENVTAEMFDISHFKKLRFKYQLMSVPALLIDQEHLIVGKMEIEDMLDVIMKYL